MADVGDVTIRLRAKDEVSPVLRRLGWTMWWFRHSGVVVTALFAVSVVLAFVLGRLT